MSVDTSVDLYSYFYSKNNLNKTTITDGQSYGLSNNDAIRINGTSTTSANGYYRTNITDLIDTTYAEVIIKFEYVIVDFNPSDTLYVKLEETRSSGTTTEIVSTHTNSDNNLIQNFEYSITPDSSVTKTILLFHINGNVGNGDFVYIQRYANFQSKYNLTSNFLKAEFIVPSTDNSNWTSNYMYNDTTETVSNKSSLDHGQDDDGYYYRMNSTTTIPYINYPDTTEVINMDDFGTNGLTFECWVKYNTIDHNSSSNSFQYILLETDSTYTDHYNIAEIKCYINNVNVALATNGGSATFTNKNDITDTNDSPWPNNNYPASNAINGNLGDIAHSNGGSQLIDGKVYNNLLVKLPQSYPLTDIQRIIVYNRTSHSMAYAYRYKYTKYLKLFDENLNTVHIYEHPEADYSTIKYINYIGPDDKNGTYTKYTSDIYNHTLDSRSLSTSSDALSGSKGWLLSFETGWGPTIAVNDDRIGGMGPSPDDKFTSSSPGYITDVENSDKLIHIVGYWKSLSSTSFERGVYINNKYYELNNSTQPTLESASSGNNYLTILGKDGSESSHHCKNCQIYSFRVWHTKLEQSDVNILYNNGPNGSVFNESGTSIFILQPNTSDSFDYYKLKLVFRQTTDYLYPSSTTSIPNLNTSDETSTNYSLMEDLDDYTYDFVYNSSTITAYHFVMISYDQVGNGSDSYIEKYRQEWIQTNNPNSSTTSGYNYDYLQPEYTDNAWNGIAKTSNTTAGNWAVITGGPGTSSLYYSIGAKQLYNGGIISINNHNASRVELYMFYNPNETFNVFNDGLSVTGTLDIQGEIYSPMQIGEIKMFPPTVDAYYLRNSFIPCDGRIIRSHQLGGQYQKLIDFLTQDTSFCSVKIPNYNDNFYLSYDGTSTYNDYTNGSILKNNMLPSHSHNIACGVNDIVFTLNTNNNFTITPSYTTQFHNMQYTVNAYNSNQTSDHQRVNYQGVQGGGNSCLSTATNHHSHSLTKIDSTNNLDLYTQNKTFDYNLQYNTFQYQSIGTINNANVVLNQDAATDGLTLNTNSLEIPSELNVVKRIPASCGVLYFIRYK